MKHVECILILIPATGEHSDMCSHCEYLSYLRVFAMSRSLVGFYDKIILFIHSPQYIQQVGIL